MGDVSLSLQSQAERGPPAAPAGRLTSTVGGPGAWAPGWGWLRAAVEVGETKGAELRLLRAPLPHQSNVISIGSERRKGF